MPANPTGSLAVKAALLERHAPVEWQAFKQELAVYVEVHRKNLISSPLPELPVNQGRAQSLSALLDTLNDARAIAEKMDKKS